MTRRYIFADESGDFVFAKQNASRYFIVCTVAMDNCDCANELLKLRRDLVWEELPVQAFFHATVDAQSVRDRVFETISRHSFTVQATIMEKSKAQPKVRSTNDTFYKYGWHYHFKNSLARHVNVDDELLITAASVSKKSGQRAFTAAVNDVVQQQLPRKQWRTTFPQSMADPCLQLADYCTWAIQRRWERGDLRSYDLIKSRISYEYELWAHGRVHHY